MNVDFKSLMNLSVTICLIFSGSECVWLSQIHHFQAVAFITNYVNFMRQRCEYVVKDNGGLMRYLVVMTYVFFVVICQYRVLWWTVEWYFTLFYTTVYIYVSSLWGRHIVFALSVCPSVRLAVCPSVTLRFRSIIRVPRVPKLHRVIALIELKTPIDFGVSRSKVKVTVTWRVKNVSAQ